MSFQVTGTLGGRVETATITSIDGRPQATIRAEFEPELVSPYGLHFGHDSCARGWDSCPSGDADMRRQVAAADAFLRECVPARRTSDASVCNSYFLKHLAEDWHRSRGEHEYVSNGALIMAALRLGLKVETPTGFGWERREHHNPYIAVSAKSVKAIEKAINARRN
jgi:hypothetical protein